MAPAVVGPQHIQEAVHGAWTPVEREAKAGAACRPRPTRPRCADSNPPLARSLLSLPPFISSLALASAHHRLAYSTTISVSSRSSPSFAPLSAERPQFKPHVSIRFTVEQQRHLHYNRNSSRDDSHGQSHPSTLEGAVAASTDGAHHPTSRSEGLHEAADSIPHLPGPLDPHPSRSAVSDEQLSCSVSPPRSHLLNGPRPSVACSMGERTVLEVLGSGDGTEVGRRREEGRTEHSLAAER